MRTSLTVLALLLLAGCPAPVDDADGDGFDATEDCDDADPDVFPGADERCNGVDDDCDGEVDEDDAVDATTWYADADHDGHGSPDDLVQACEQPEGYVDDATDCDDHEPQVTGPWSWYPDDDEDGYGDDDEDGLLACSGPTGWTEDHSDCDDSDASVHPDQEDGCNEVDDDCDGEVDEDPPPWYLDVDRDGWGTEVTSLVTCDPPSGYAAQAGDCDDEDPDFHPEAEDLCEDGIDHDCNGFDPFCAFEGEIDLTLHADAMIVGEEEGDLAGASLAPAGDQNGDGYDDFFVGAIGNEAVSGGKGAVYLLHGPVTGRVELADADVKLWSASKEYGGDELSTGDFDGDGVLDLAVGAPDYGPASEGRVYVLTGPVCSSGNLYGYEFLGAEHSWAGDIITFAGDTNGDGLEDLSISAPGWGWEDYDYNFHRIGAVYLITDIPNSPTWLDDAELSIYGWEGAVSGGYATGDVNGDGYDDWAVSAETGSGWGTHLFYSPVTGSVDVEDADAVVIDGRSVVVADVGDLDGDGTGDLVVGAPWDSDSTDWKGAVYVFHGPLRGSVEATDASLVLLGPSDGFRAGAPVVASEDFNGDSVRDLVVHDDFADPWPTYFVSGYEDLSGTFLLDDAHAILGAPPDGCPGYGMSPVGDIDADGLADLALWDKCTESEGVLTGVAYVVLGR